LQILVGHVADLSVFQLHAAVTEFLPLQHDELSRAQAEVGPAGLLGPEAEKLRVVVGDHCVADKIRRRLGRHGFAAGAGEAEQNAGRPAAHGRSRIEHRRDL